MKTQKKLIKSIFKSLDKGTAMDGTRKSREID